MVEAAKARQSAIKALAIGVAVFVILALLLDTLLTVKNYITCNLKYAVIYSTANRVCRKIAQILWVAPRMHPYAPHAPTCTHIHPSYRIIRPGDTSGLLGYIPIFSPVDEEHKT